MYFRLEITLAENDHMTGWKITQFSFGKYIDDSFIGGFPMPVMLVNSGGGGGRGFMDFPS